MTTYPIKAEYIWLDGYTPEPNLRSKTKILEVETTRNVTLDTFPYWSFDGSSTKQAEGNFSDCILMPVKFVWAPTKGADYFVLCEVFNADGTPHESNTRAKLLDDEHLWLGFEQEYTLVKDGRPLGFPTNGYPEPQGKYYCAVGAGAVDGRDIVEEHLNLCLEAELNITGINAEVMLGQWEFQVMGKGSRDAADQLWLARYFLHRVTEKYGVQVEFHPKPIKGDWNGSGLHTNFSNYRMREEGGEDYFNKIFKAFEQYKDQHIACYGSSNEERLTGLHETQSIHKFTWGISDRGASIRIPQSTAKEWKGYLEDRRPASNADPYRVASAIYSTLYSIR